MLEHGLPALAATPVPLEVITVSLITSCYEYKGIQVH